MQYRGLRNCQYLFPGFLILLIVQYAPYPYSIYSGIYSRFDGRHLRDCPGSASVENREICSLPHAPLHPRDCKTPELRHIP